MGHCQQIVLEQAEKISKYSTGFSIVHLTELDTLSNFKCPTAANASNVVPETLL